MTRDDIIRMAREHHVNSEYTEFGWQEVSRYEFNLKELVDFAALVAAAEREECAKVAARWDADVETRTKPSDAIRARGAL